MESIKPGERFQIELVSGPIYGDTIPFTGEGFFIDADLKYRNGKYVATTRAPSMEGQIGIHNLIWTSSNGKVFSLYVEVTCSNGIYCDGPEYFAGGKCVKGRNPCDDPEPIPGVTCTTCECHENFGNITFTLVSDNIYCSACNVSDLLPCDCTGRTCGNPGNCIGSCGECTVDGEYCVDGNCRAVNYLGSCQNAIPLVSDPSTIYDGVITIYGDTNNTEYVHTHQPQCNPNKGPSLFYSFTLTKRSGFDVRLQSSSGDPSALDTVMEIRDGDCNLLVYPSSETCSDDGVPPGGVGSGIRATLSAGNYTILVTSYNENNVGPFVLTAAFFENQCIPACNSLYCGETLCTFRDGTKFDCFMGPFNKGFTGDCENQGLVCRDGGCVQLNCSPNCTEKTCGPDGCGGSCGSCEDPELCVDALGVCRKFTKCDHLLPYCPTKCKKNEYCGSDCECHGIDDFYLDLTVNYDELKSSVLIETVYFTNLSCTLSQDEGPCIEKEGDRTLLRLTTTVANIGFRSFSPLQPSNLFPNIYTYSSCHRHYHFNDFALFYLYDPTTSKVVKSGGKRAYCLTDSTRRHKAPWVPCNSVFGCSQQGLQAGWSDDYQNSLDCQWIDITDVKPGQYELYCFTNPVRVFNEGSFDNQGQRVLISIPDTSKRNPQKVEIIQDLGRVPSSFFFQKNSNKK